MTHQTRYFLIGACGLLVAGLCAGLFAYLNREAALAESLAGPVGLSYIPADASVVAYANIREVMQSEVRERIRQVAPDGIGQDWLERSLGLNIEQDIDHVVAFMAPGPDQGRPAGLVLFRGRFDQTRLVEVARSGGAAVETYAGIPLVSVDAGDAGTLAMAFMEPGLVAVGDLGTVQRAVDRRAGGAGLVSNPAMMALLERIDGGSNAWAAGRFDDLGSFGFLPDDISAQMPAISGFALSGRVNGGLSGALMIEGRDGEAGQNLRDVFRGFLALAKMQATGRPEWQAMVESLRLSGTGPNVTLSFWVPSEILDLMFTDIQPDSAS